VITSIARKEGEDVKIGELLAVVDENGSGTAPPAAAGSGDGSKAAAAAQPAAATPPTPAEPAEEPRATPTARRMAKDHEVDLGGVQGTGAAGRVTKQDVRSAITPAAPTSDTRAPALELRRGEPTASKPIAPARTGDRTEERVRMTKRRQTIARRLVEAQQTAAMLTTFNEADMTQIMALRERRKESFKKEFGVGLGIASFFVKASIAALRAFPALNAEIQGDEIVYKHYFDMGMAVGAEGGLVVPVIRDADRMTFPQIELAIRDLAKKAQDGTLTLEDLRGGTFTITNGGVFGSLLSTPILNPPQVAILGLHKIQDRVVPVNGQPAIRPMMYLALSYDHRIVDGREAVRFLVKVKEYIEDPANLLIEG
jgi:2-oxoglutarate dehydrogenase E2 component (dihydrolipoamide succinyltransferase)